MDDRKPELRKAAQQSQKVYQSIKEVDPENPGNVFEQGEDI